MITELDTQSAIDFCGRNNLRLHLQPSDYVQYFRIIYQKYNSQHKSRTV